MGIKLFGLHRIPLSCFQLLGSHEITLSEPQPPSVKTIKLIKSDGLVNIYDRPVPVSDLMLEFPKHMICRSDSFYIGQKIPPLSQNDQLQLGQKYFLLPNHLFQSVLSFVTIASFFASCNSRPQFVSSSPLLPNSNRNYNSGFVKKSASLQRPFDIQKSSSGSLRIRVSDDFISQLLERGKENQEEEEARQVKKVSRLCNTPLLVKDYTQLVRLRTWKPRLETITETTDKRKVLSFRMKISIKSQSNGTHQLRNSPIRMIPKRNLQSLSSSRSPKRPISKLN